MSSFEQQKAKFRNQPGFIAALDQSGGSTPKALKLYGIAETEYSGDVQMMDLIHAMRTRIITSPSFNGDRILAAILFENTMDREIEGRPTADYLWKVKRVVPILKVDKGLEAEANGVQLMKPMPDLDKLLARAKAKGIFGTKMRSVIKQANAAGIKAVVEQQFAVGRQIIAAGLVPIIEPEVDIKCPDKAAAEDLLKAEIMAQLDKLPEGQLVMLKLTLPEQGQPVRRLHRAPARAQGGGAVGRLFAGRGEPAAGEAEGHGGELLAGAHRRPDGAADRGGVRRSARPGDREHLPGIEDLSEARSHPRVAAAWSGAGSVSTGAKPPPGVRKFVVWPR